MKIITVAILFIVLLSANYLLREAKNRLKNKAGILKKVATFFPIIELIIWVLFISWTAFFLNRDSTIQRYVDFFLITIFFVFASWFFIRDYISGIQIKSRFNLSPGQSFKSGQVQGTVRKVGVLVLELKTESGSNMKLPYAQIDQKSIELNFEEKRGGENTFHIELDSQLSEKVVMERIAQLIINSPWSSYKSAPIIKVTSADLKQKTYEISCFTTAENGTSRIKDLIHTEFKAIKFK